MGTLQISVAGQLMSQGLPEKSKMGSHVGEATGDGRGHLQTAAQVWHL